MLRLTKLATIAGGLLMAAGCASTWKSEFRPATATAPAPTQQTGAARAAGDKGPVYVCRFTSSPPVIDGKLDDPAWQQAGAIHLVRAEDGGKPHQPTTVRALWDEKYLYLAYDCTDTDIWAGYTKHDEHIYDQEVVEVFLNENCDGRSYAELEVSPNNTTLDVYILNPDDGPHRKGLFDWECKGLKTAVVVDGTVGREPSKTPKNDKRWTVEMAIPFDQLILMPNHPPWGGDSMRWNLFRIDRPGMGPVEDECSSLSPTGEGTFHKPSRFGTLVFVR